MLLAVFKEVVSHWLGLFNGLRAFVDWRILIEFECEKIDVIVAIVLSVASLRVSFLD